MTPRRARTRHLTWNTHLNKTATPAVWKWIQQRFPRLHIIYFQEVLHPVALAELLGDDWALIPYGGVGRCSTFIALRKERFPRWDSYVVRLKSRAKFDRRIIGFSALDVRLHRMVSAGSLHTDPLGAGFERATRGARNLHVGQGRGWMRWAKARKRQWPLGVVYIGGDGNEAIGWPTTARLLGRKTLVAMLGRAGLTPASHETGQRNDVYLDDLFVTDAGHTDVIKRWQGRPPRDVNGAEHFDHDLVFVVTETDVLVA